MKLYQLLSTLDDSEVVRIKRFDCSWEMNAMRVDELLYGIIKDYIDSKVVVYDSHDKDYSFIAVENWGGDEKI